MKPALEQPLKQPLEQRLAKDAHKFDQAPPENFRATLGEALRQAPPPALPVPERFGWVTFRNTAIATVAAAAGIIILIGLSAIKPAHDPAHPAGLAATTPSSQVDDTTYEHEWDNLKADAITFSSPFRSAFPTSLIRVD